MTTINTPTKGPLITEKNCLSMSWNISIANIPGIEMFVLSTNFQMMRISAKIKILFKEHKNNFQHHIDELKIMQLTHLTRVSTSST